MADKTLSKEHVLVDDQDTYHVEFELLADLYRIANYEMFNTSDEMLEYEPNKSLKWLFLDWNLIGSTIQKGPLIKLMRKRLNESGFDHVKIYVLSTSDHEDELKEAEEAGANGWIYKPDFEETIEIWQKERSTVKEFKLWKAK